MRIPAGAFTVVKEILRHVLRRPVVGIAIVGRDAEGRVLLVRRADTGEWALPGGTLEWGETLRSCLVRELREECNARAEGEIALVGVYSEPARDPRFHGVTVVAACAVVSDAPRAENPVEIREVRFFEARQIPAKLAFGMQDMLKNALDGDPPTLE